MPHKPCKGGCRYDGVFGIVPQGRDANRFYGTVLLNFTPEALVSITNFGLGFILDYMKQHDPNFQLPTNGIAASFWGGFPGIVEQTLVAKISDPSDNFLPYATKDDRYVGNVQLCRSAAVQANYIDDLHYDPRRQAVVSLYVLLDRIRDRYKDNDGIVIVTPWKGCCGFKAGRVDAEWWELEDHLRSEGLL